MTSAKIDGGIALLVDTELIVLAGQDRVHTNADQSSHSQAGQADGHHTQIERNGAGDIILFLTLIEHKTAVVRKEARKAEFIKNDPEWEKLFVKAEKHPYFHGSIDFLIDDFCF